MKKVPVLAWKHYPAKLPIIPTIVFWLALERLSAPGWAWGVVGTILVVGWVLNIIALFRQEQRSPRWDW